ncbi:glycosyltransferase [Sphingopyxis sp. XHP0097]|uniref:Glycosyltransferase n=1 Tax=Sphingopyxis jiangsuensis TaxID=2871171 RepID=A0ABS7MBM7_9SPHN|nr:MULTISPECIES: glycosyltransferase [Sphingopyxis]MBY4636213.1 glycosyltransferase [Sphingopyxis jiangsuensis]
MSHSAQKRDDARRIYLSVRAKFMLALGIAIAWTSFSVVLSQRWMAELAAVTSWTFALIAIGFIAYVPGFMNAFLIATLALDRRPPVEKLPRKLPGVTILVAAYNEAAAIRDTLTSLSRQDYRGPLEVLVLNDGSTDDTAAIVRELLKTLAIPKKAKFELLDFPVNRGKSAALNDGLRASSHGLVITIDGDCWVKRNGVARIVGRYLSDPDDTAAIAGAVMVRNSRANLLTRAQEWDYFHGIAAVKRMQGMYHGTLVAQGAFSLYRRDALDEVGGWPECVGEDIVVSWALLARGYRIGYADSALAFTNVPEGFRQFALQRKRWSRGLMEAFKAHWELLFKRRMTTLFIWWNVTFLPLDLVYSFVFIPGLVLAVFGHFYIAGPLTLAVLPLAALWNVVIFRIQRNVYENEDLKVRHNPAGFLFYALVYSLIMQPVCVWGYLAEIIGMKKKWDTK